MTLFMMDWNSSSVYSRVGNGTIRIFDGPYCIHGTLREDSDEGSSISLVSDCWAAKIIKESSACWSCNIMKASVMTWIFTNMEPNYSGCIFTCNLIEGEGLIKAESNNSFS